MSAAVPRRARRRGAGERGAAAVEFAIYLPMLFVLLSVALPLASMLVTQLRLERVAAASSHFATAMPGGTVPGQTFTAGQNSQRPTCQDVVNDVRARAAAAGVAEPLAVTVTVYYPNGAITAAAKCSAPAHLSAVLNDAVDATGGSIGSTVSRLGLQDWGAVGTGTCVPSQGPCPGSKQVTVTADKHLGFFGFIAAAAGLPAPSTVSMTASAANRQE